MPFARGVLCFESTEPVCDHFDAKPWLWVPLHRTTRPSGQVLCNGSGHSLHGQRDTDPKDRDPIAQCGRAAATTCKGNQLKKMCCNWCAVHLESPSLLLRQKQPVHSQPRLRTLASRCFNRVVDRSIEDLNAANRVLTRLSEEKFRSRCCHVGWHRCLFEC